MFSVDLAACPIATYTLQELVDATPTYKAYTGTLMTIDGSNNLLLDTSASIETTIYLKASTASGTSPAYLPLVISVGATALSNALN